MIVLRSGTPRSGMSHALRVIEACEVAAWDQYEAHSCRAAQLARQGDLFDTARAAAREWLGIAVACSAAASAEREP